MINYSPTLPRDEAGNVKTNYVPPFKANARYGTNNAIVSSVITLDDNSTEIEVSAVGAAVAVRWVPVTETAAVSPFASVITTGTGTNFDYVVPKDAVRRFVAPIESRGVQSIVGTGVMNGAYRRVAVVASAAVSSIMVSEF